MKGVCKINWRGRYKGCSEEANSFEAAEKAQQVLWPAEGSVQGREISAAKAPVLPQQLRLLLLLLLIAASTCQCLTSCRSQSAQPLHGPDISHICPHETLSAAHTKLW